MDTLKIIGEFICVLFIASLIMIPIRIILALFGTPPNLSGDINGFGVLFLIIIFYKVYKKRKKL